MTLDFLTEYFVPIVVAACLIIGFCLKQLKVIPNRFIPTILAVIGAVLACVNAKGISLQMIVYGAFSGLASTGMHQAFKQIIYGNEDKEKDPD